MRAKGERDLEGLLTISEVATALNVSAVTVRRIITKQELSTVRVGERHVRITPAALRSYIAAQTRGSVSVESIVPPKSTTKPLPIRTNEGQIREGVSWKVLQADALQGLKSLARSLQLCDDPLKSASSEARHVLSRTPNGSDLSNDAEILGKKLASRVAEPRANARNAEALARRGPDDHVGKVSEARSNSVSCDGTDILEHLRVREGGGEHRPSPRVDLAGGDRAIAGTVQADGPAADATREEIEDGVAQNGISSSRSSAIEAALGLLGAGRAAVAPGCGVGDS